MSLTTLSRLFVNSHHSDFRFPTQVTLVTCCSRPCKKLPKGSLCAWATTGIIFHYMNSTGCHDFSFFKIADNLFDSCNAFCSKSCNRQPPRTQKAPEGVSAFWATTGPRVEPIGRAVPRLVKRRKGLF